MKDIDPNAPAQRDDGDYRSGVVEYSPLDIFHYVYKPDGNCILHVWESARAFAEWANESWFEYHDGEDGTTNKHILDGMLTDWRGDVSQP